MVEVTTNLEQLKIKNMQKYGLNLLKGLDNKEKDDALKLYVL